MTLRLRNTLMIFLSVISAAAIGLVIYEFLTGGRLMRISGLETLLPIVALMGSSAAGCILIFFAFRNTASAEILFYFLFIFTLMFDFFKVIILALPEANFPISYGMITTRLVYFGRILGALSLFSAGLFDTGLEYQRTGLVFLISIILTVALVWMLPINVSTIVPGGTWEIGKFHYMTIAVNFFNLLAVVNFIIAGSKNENREYFLIAAGFLLAAAGRELLFFLSGIVPFLAGFIMLLSGTLIVGFKIHRLYLWE